MLPRNFPARKLIRKSKANKEPVLMVDLSRARAIRSKKNRTGTGRLR